MNFKVEPHHTIIIIQYFNKKIDAASQIVLKDDNMHSIATCIVHRPPQSLFHYHCVHTHVQLHTYTYTHTCTNTHTHTHTHTLTHTCTHTNMHTHTHTHAHTHECTHTHTHTHTHTCTHTHARMHALTHTHTHTHTHKIYSLECMFTVQVPLLSPYTCSFTSRSSMRGCKINSVMLSSNSSPSTLASIVDSGPQDSSSFLSCLSNIIG